MLSLHLLLGVRISLIIGSSLSAHPFGEPKFFESFTDALFFLLCCGFSLVEKLFVVLFDAT